MEIYLKYIGKFEIPSPDMSAEELKADEKLRHESKRNHEKYLRRKARKQEQQVAQLTPC